MVAGISINQFKGTPLLALANNANVNGGETLTKLEIAIMQQQMKNLGITFEEYGLSVSSLDLEGTSSKETRSNVAQAGSDLNKAYKKQFGSKNGVSVAQTAELKADAIIKTALDMFKSEHPDILFTPKNLGTRPQFTQPKYKDNPAVYAMDLSDWASTVKLEYINATKLSNEALAAMIVDNSNNNTALLSAELLAYANELMEEVAAGTAQVISTVKDSEGNIVKTVKNAEGHIVRVVQNSANKVISVVKEEGVITRNTVREVGADIINDNREEHSKTRKVIIEETTKNRNKVRYEAFRNRLVTKRTAKETQELEAMNTAIAERVSVLTLTTAWPSLSIRIGNMQKQIAQANIPHRIKIELLQRVRNQLAEVYTTDSELDDLQKIIDKRINATKNYLDMEKIPPYIESPDYSEEPTYVEPIYEGAQENDAIKNETSNAEKAKVDCEKPKKDDCTDITYPVKGQSTEDKIKNNVNNIFKK